MGNPYEPKTCGVGYMGVGKYRSRDKNHKKTKAYTTWHNMLVRCYSDKYHIEKSSYINCEVCEEWKNFQNFDEWFENNYYEIEGEKMHLDKDILMKGNKIYSPDNCIFVPQKINDLFTKCDKSRGTLPIGTRETRHHTFESRCNVMKKSIHLGNYKTPEEAFKAYKQFKENYIKEVAEEYKGKIPTKLYKALYNYQVEIND